MFDPGTSAAVWASELDLFGSMVPGRGPSDIGGNGVDLSPVFIAMAAGYVEFDDACPGSIFLIIIRS